MKPGESDPGKAVVIGTYAGAPARFAPPDAGAENVALAIGELILEQMPTASIEHVGSTAVAGLGGKGVIDLMLLYPAGELPAARDALDRLGFQRQAGRDPFPEDRPMRVGSVDWEGKRYRIHVHVIAADSAEAADMVEFRTRLRRDSGLREMYSRLKQAIVGRGTQDSLEYWKAKSEFFRHAALTLRVTKAADLRPGELQRILTLCREAYVEDLEPLFRTFRDAQHVLGYLGQELVTHAAWITRWLQVEQSEPMRTAYVEAVATAPAHQHRGYASTVLQRVVEEAAGMDLAALAPSDEGVQLYTRLGWETWRGPLFIRHGEELISTPDEVVMILKLPATPALDLDAPLSAEWREGELW